MTQSLGSSVIVERERSVARLVLNRPPLNLLDLETIHQLNVELGEVLSDDSVRLIEIQGTESFSAGVEIRDHFPDRAPQMLREFHALIRAVLYARCPTLAVVCGHCLGGGLELAMACDFIIASDGARFAQPEIKVGCFPPVAAVLLPRLIPEKKALEMILTAQAIGAEEAYRWGLVSRVAPAAALERVANEFSNALLAQSPQVLALARKAARLGSRETFESVLRESERIYVEELLPAADVSEGLRAFLEKRPPHWMPSGPQPRE